MLKRSYAVFGHFYIHAISFGLKQFLDTFEAVIDQILNSGPFWWAVGSR